MNKKLLAFAALPVIFGAAGFGAGKLMAPAPATAGAHEAVEAAEPDSSAKDTLHRLAEEDDHKPAPAVAPAGHDAKVIPAATPHTPEKTHATKQAEKPEAHAAAPARTKAIPAKARPVQPQVHGGGVTELQPGMMSEAQIKDSKVVKLGRITVPVHRPNSITYVVTDIGVSVADLETATHFNVAENATRLRDAIILSMHKAAGTPVMRNASIDTQSLSEALSTDIKHDFGDKMGEVLFLSLFKADVPRS